MIQRIKEIRECLNTKHYEAALALTLTLPDICGQIEYPNAGVGERYREWISDFVDKERFCASIFANGFEYLISADVNCTPFVRQYGILLTSGVLLYVSVKY